jgi:hypothetical protein
MRNYRLLKNDLNDAHDQITQGVSNLRTVAKDAERVSLVAKDVHIIIKDIDRQFAEATKLNAVDITFLFFATGLQVARQYLLTNFKERPGDQDAANNTPGHIKEHSNRSHQWYRPSKEEVWTNPVPFDAIYGSKDFNINIGGGFNHRASTLGHDPILGWIFGTANIATSTVTLSKWPLPTYHVKTGNIITGSTRDKITNHANTVKVFTTTKERLLNEGTDGKIVIGSSLIKEAIHLRSDVNSKASLPLPLISVISPEFARMLANYGLDMANVETVMSQATFAILINTFVAMIHGLFYDEKECGSWNLYEVRTRKILSYSNIIASASNIIQATVRAALGDVEGATKSLDIGGFIVTLYTVVTNSQFIEKVKQEFLEKEFYNTVMGQDFNF